MKTFIIALNAFKEAVRDRIMYVLLLFAILVIIASRAIAWISMEQDVKVLKDLGLAAISLFSVLIAIFVGTSLISKEMEKRTVYSVLSKPVTRPAFLIGRYLGLALTLLVIVAAMGAVFMGYAWLLGIAPDMAVTKAIGLIFVELLVVTAIAVFFSAVTSPILGAVFTFCAYIVGHTTDGLRLLAEQAQTTAGATAAKALYYGLPNLDAFNVKQQAAHGIAVSTAQVAAAAGYGVLYAGVVLLLATLLFQRKNF